MPEGGTSNGGSMHVRIRRTGALATAAVVLATGIATGTVQPASAAASWPSTVLAAPLKSLANPTSLAYAGGHLFATDILASKVQVYDETGALVRTISPIANARSAVVSPDGSHLYVAGYSSIVEIDTTTLLGTGSWQVAPCVQGLAVTPTAVYYGYGFGCDGMPLGGLNHIDLTTRTVHDPTTPDVADLERDGVRLAYADGTLWALEYHGNLRAWDHSGQTLSNPRTTSVGVYGGLVMSAHDSRLALSGGGKATIYSASDLSVIRTWTPPGQTIWSAAFSPDGSTLVAAGYGSLGFMAWDTTTGDPVFTTAAPGGAAIYSEPTDTAVVWNTAGTAVYTLFRQSGSNTDHALVATGLQAPAAQTLALTVKAPATYGAYTSLYLKGRPGATVRLTLSSNSTTVVRTLTLSATGRAILTLKLLTNFRVSAATAATLAFTGKSVSAKSFVVPSRMTVVSSPGYKTVNGVTYYHRVGDAKHRIRLEPAVGVRNVTVTAWKWSGGRWVKVTNQAFPTSTAGGLMITFVSVSPRTRYRLTFAFVGDWRNGRSSAVTKPFMIA